jgi:hypothetical protein
MRDYALLKRLWPRCKVLSMETSAVLFVGLLIVFVFHLRFGTVASGGLKRSQALWVLADEAGDAAPVP